MQKAKSFLAVSLGILALSVAFHFGARSAEGQSGSDEVVRVWESSGDRNHLWVITKNGEAYLLRSKFSTEGTEIQVLAKGNIHSEVVR